MLNRGGAGDVLDIAGSSHVVDWNYFMSQALAIWAEETVLKLPTILRIRQILGDGLARVVGYLWTGAFTLYSFKLWVDWAAAAGSWTEGPLGASVASVFFGQIQ